MARFGVAVGLDERYGRTGVGRRRAAVLGLGVLGGGAVGARGVGGVILVATFSGSLASGGPSEADVMIPMLAAVIGGGLGAVSGLCAIAVSRAAGAALKGGLRQVGVVAGAALGGGASTGLLIDVAHLVPDASAVAPAALSVLTAGLDAVVAAVLVRAPRI